MIFGHKVIHTYNYCLIRPLNVLNAIWTNKMHVYAFQPLIYDTLLEDSSSFIYIIMYI